MNPASITLLTAVIVVAGRWSQDKTIDIRLVVGGLFLAIGLTAISQTNEKIGKLFSALILTTVVFTYGESIVKKAGLVK